MVTDILGYSRGDRAPAAAPVAENPPEQAAPVARPARRNATIQLDPARPDPAGSALCDGQKWRRFVHALASDEQLTVVRGMLARSGFLSADGDTIRVGFFSAVTLRNVEGELDDSNLRAAARAWFGRDVTIACSLDDAGASGRSLAEELDRIRAEKAADLRAKALSHPAVTGTLDIFPGSTVLGEPRIPEIQEITDVQ